MAFVCDEPSDAWRCLGCGCTNARACMGGCAWVAEDKCDRCFGPDGLPYAVGDADEDRFGFEPCPASETPAPHVALFTTPTLCKCARCGTELAA